MTRKKTKKRAGFLMPAEKNSIKLSIVSILFSLALTGCFSSMPYGEEIFPEQAIPAQRGKSSAKRGGGISLRSPDVPTENVFTLSRLAGLTLERNPAILASRYRWLKAIEKYPQEVSLPDPALLYSYTFGQETSPEEHKIELMQEIPFPGKLYWKGEIARNGAQLARLAYEIDIRDTLSRVQKGCYELAYLEGAIEITRDIQKLLEHFVKVASVEYDAKKANLSDVMRAQSQLAQMTYDIVRLEELRQVEIGELNAIANLPASYELRLEKFVFADPAPIVPFDDLYRKALKRQELLAAQIEIVRSKNNIALAQSDYFPDFSIGGTWNRKPVSMGREEMFMLMFGVTLPLWFPKKDAQVREARSDWQSVTAMKKEMENRLAAQLKRVYYKAKNAQRLVELYRKSLLPQARHSMTIAENGYRDGQSTFLGILEAQNIYLNFSLATLRAQSDHAQSLVEIAQLCGGDFSDAPIQKRRK